MQEVAGGKFAAIGASAWELLSIVDKLAALPASSDEAVATGAVYVGVPAHDLTEVVNALGEGIASTKEV